MTDQLERERALIAHYLVLRSDHPRNAGVGVEHFTSGAHRSWWAKAMERDDFTPWDLGIDTEVVADLSGPAYAYNERHVPGIVDAVRRHWAAERVRWACASAQDRLRKGEELEPVCTDLLATVEDARAGCTNSTESLATVGQRVLETYAHDIRDKSSRTLPIFLPAMQDALGGWVLGKLHLIVARSSEHKTTMARQAAEHIAFCGHPVLYWTMEDSSEDIAIRDIASASVMTTRDIATAKVPGVVADAWRTKLANPNYDSPYAPERVRAQADAHAARETAHRFWLLDIGSPTLSQIAPEVGRAVARHGVRAVVLDFAQLIGPDRGHEDAQHWKRVSAHLAALAKRYKIALIACAQIDKQATRDSEDSPDRHPRLSDIYGGAAWKQNAFAGLTLWKTQDGRAISINVEKWKSAGPMLLENIPVDAAHDRIEVK